MVDHHKHNWKRIPRKHKNPLRYFVSCSCGEVRECKRDTGRVLNKTGRKRIDDELVKKVRTFRASDSELASGWTIISVSGTNGAKFKLTRL